MVRDGSRTTSSQRYSRVLSHEFGVVQAHRTSLNLLEPHHRRDSMVCRVHQHEFRVVQLCRTFSTLIFTEEARCACTSSGWFRYIEPPRTFLNHIIAEIMKSTEVQNPRRCLAHQDLRIRTHIWLCACAMAYDVTP